MKLYDYNFDLNFNSLDTINQKLIIYIYNFQTKIFYKFKITDLIKIINYSICYMNDNIHDILDIKNPFPWLAELMDIKILVHFRRSIVDFFLIHEAIVIQH